MATTSVQTDKMYAYANKLLDTGMDWNTLAGMIQGYDIPALAFGGGTVNTVNTTHPPPNTTKTVLWQPDLAAAYNQIWSKYLALSRDGEQTMADWSRALQVVANHYIGTDTTNATSMGQLTAF
jgi:hypothetical protein